jgi:hypothetical protein
LSNNSAVLPVCIERRKAEEEWRARYADRPKKKQETQGKAEEDKGRSPAVVALQGGVVTERVKDVVCPQGSVMVGWLVTLWIVAC